jgi:hypothetical protein
VEKLGSPDEIRKWETENEVNVENKFRQINPGDAFAGAYFNQR